MNGSTHNGQDFLERLTAITEENLTNAQFGVSELAQEMGMSRSNLHLKVKKSTKKSVSQFINQIRLKKAMELLKLESLTVSEAAFESGFHSVTYFTKCFNDYYGYPPGKVGNWPEAYLGSFIKKAIIKKKAFEYYSRAVELYLNHINSPTPVAAKYISHFYLAGTYSAMGEKEKALKYLGEVNNRTTIPSYMITYINDWPLFDNIRNEPEFQKLKNEFEKKYQKEHNCVARLLREKGEIFSASASN